MYEKDVAMPFLTQIHPISEEELVTNNNVDFTAINKFRLFARHRRSFLQSCLTFKKKIVLQALLFKSDRTRERGLVRQADSIDI